MGIGKDKPPRLQLTGDPNEDQFQASVANLLDAILPDTQVAWTHIAHGGYELSGAARGRLYRLGLKRGFPDLCLCYAPGRTLWIECKTITGRLSIDQKQKHEVLRKAGHNVVVVRRIEEVIAALQLYGVPFRRARLAEGYLGAEVHQSDAQSITKGTTQGTAASSIG